MRTIQSKIKTICISVMIMMMSKVEECNIGKKIVGYFLSKYIIHNRSLLECNNEVNTLTHQDANCVQFQVQMQKIGDANRVQLEKKIHQKYSFQDKCVEF